MRSVILSLVLLAASVDAAEAQNCKKGKPCGVSRTPIMATPGARVPCTVSKITDGDTLRCEEYSKSVRLLLIDTPEMNQGAYGTMARIQMMQLVPVGSVVELEFDVEVQDRYERSLAYVWVGKRLVNEEIARSGYAVSLTYPPNVKYVDRIRSAVEEAKAAKRGLWSGSAFECTPQDHRAKRC